MEISIAHLTSPERGHPQLEHDISETRDSDDKTERVREKLCLSMTYMYCLCVLSGIQFMSCPF